VNALRSAIDFGSMNKAEIHVLHVIELPVIHDSVLMPVLTFEEALLKELKEKAHRTFQKVLKVVDNEGAEINFLVSFGPVHRVILTYVDDKEIDLVMMGTKGTSGIQEIIIGSITEKIVRSSKAPVLVVRDAIHFARIRKIIFPTNLDFESMEELAQQLKALQHFLNANLLLVSINTPANFTSDKVTLSRLGDFARRHMFTNYTLNIFNDTDAEAGIIQYAHDVGADLIVMATHGRRGLSHLFSDSLTERVVNHVDLPVWTMSLANKHAKVLN
jgi:nucleotide-binding universal stress UspA family protein